VAEQRSEKLEAEGDVGFEEYVEPNEALAGRIDALMAAVFDVDDERRMRAIGDNVTGDFLLVNPSIVVKGAAGLSDAYNRFRRQSERAFSVRRTSEVEVHHRFFRYSWARQEQGRTIHEGVDFGWTDDHGLVQRIVVFNGTLPPPQAPA
jgi:hypothetical protein